jgi:hypothetical protein
MGERLLVCYAAIQHSFPGYVFLLLPNREVLPKGYRLIVSAVGPKFPWTSCITQIARLRDIGKNWFPTQQTLARLTFTPEFFAVHRARLKNDSIVGQEFQEGVASSFGRGCFREGALHVDQHATILRALILFLRGRGTAEGQRQDY